MNVLLDYGFAWISVVISIILSLKFLNRKLAQCKSENQKLFKKINSIMRHFHIPLGIILIITGLIHGLFSSEQVLSINLGTICWLFSIILGLNWIFKKKFNRLGGWIKYHRICTASFLILIILHIINVGGIRVFDIIANNKFNNIAEYETKNDLEDIISQEVEEDNYNDYNSNLMGVELKDGIFTGIADGYGPNLVVEVEIKNNNIKNIEIIEEHEKNVRIYGKAIEIIPNEIIEKQTIEVDTVTGDTYTSIGIMNAVNDALSKALISGSLPDMK